MAEQPIPKKYLGCLFCKFYQPDASCTAFPKGIPGNILAGEVEHAQAIEGQSGNTVYTFGGLLKNFK